MITVASHQSHVRLGVDACPGIDERGHGLSLRTLHDDGCCTEWAAGEASTEARAKEFRTVAARWGASWPKAEREAAPEAKVPLLPEATPPELTRDEPEAEI
jgi:hypothetical protein